MAASDYERRLTLPAATSAITLNADIRLRAPSDTTGHYRHFALQKNRKLFADH
jgi:hypothetical protein